MWNWCNPYVCDARSPDLQVEPTAGKVKSSNGLRARPRDRAPRRPAHNTDSEGARQTALGPVIGQQLFLGEIVDNGLGSLPSRTRRGERRESETGSRRAGSQRLQFTASALSLMRQLSWNARRMSWTCWRREGAEGCPGPGRAMSAGDIPRLGLK